MRRFFVLLALFFLLPETVFAQPFGPSLNNAQITGKLNFVGGPPPVVVGGAALGLAPLTDLSGAITTSATSGSITFGLARSVAPRCIIVDASATSTVSMPVYTVSTTAITLSTIISGHILHWFCMDVSGG